MHYQPLLKDTHLPTKDTKATWGPAHLVWVLVESLESYEQRGDSLVQGWAEISLHQLTEGFSRGKVERYSLADMGTWIFLL